MQSSHHPKFLARFQGISRRLQIIILTALAIIVAGSFLLAVYFINGGSILNSVKLGLQTERASQMQSLNEVLSRSASLSPHVELLAEYATPEFFELANRQSRGIPYDPQKSFIFILNENTHMDELPLEPTPVRLRINGQELAPANLELLAYSDHHKVSIATFPKFDADGQPFIGQTAGTLELLAPEITMTAQGRAYGDASVSVDWDLPITYPEGVLDEQQLPFGKMLALAMGLLATVMTPCLLQLLVYYLATLTGMSAEEMEGAKLQPAVRARLLQAAGGFVFGYTLLFTGVGALAGWAGQTLQGTWDAWTRPLAVIAGIFIVIMGLWMAVRSRAPLVCRLPILNRQEVQSRAHRGGLLQSTLMGLTFAVGCSTCFGGAVVATLLLYVGTLGSAWQGAAILFFFSLGVGIPFLLAAALLTRVMPLMRGLHRAAPTIGLVSSVIVAAFGFLLIFDKFHLVSSWLAPLIGLS